VVRISRRKCFGSCTQTSFSEGEFCAKSLSKRVSWSAGKCKEVPHCVVECAVNSVCVENYWKTRGASYKAAVKVLCKKNGSLKTSFFALFWGGFVEDFLVNFAAAEDIREYQSKCSTKCLQGLSSPKI
uniref:Uncharacterized protein n=1 Tax=Lutzomyia longipalpis TaxID=7200 RepID=A0A1B0CTE5_LUTLO